MTYAILHNIRSIYNVASIFRTADGLGVDTLFLSGYTPAPVDRFGRERDRFKKVALGAGKIVSWESVDDVFAQMQQLRQEGVSIIACEPVAEAVDYKEIPAKEDVCLIFGNEPDGLEQDIIDESDAVIEIQMQGEKSSLNVSVAFGIIAAHFAA
jgi:tRNA G18 (ribose-2'-O)-methylase SpoU